MVCGAFRRACDLAGRAWSGVGALESGPGVVRNWPDDRVVAVVDDQHRRCIPPMPQARGQRNLPVVTSRLPSASRTRSGQPDSR
jgi:hypothetical protein